MSENKTHMALFHHAGGNASAMHAIACHFSQEYNILLMEMPGRGRRRQEALLHVAGQVADDFASRIPTHGRLILVGHSLGAYIAYLMAGFCRAKSPDREIVLVALSNDPIHCRRHFSRLDNAPESRLALWQFATQLGDLPDWLKQDATLRQQFIEVMASDLKVANSIDLTSILPLNNVPLLVIYGEDDPYLPAPPHRWRECTNGVYRLVSIPGGHFIQSTQEQGISEIIRQFIDETTSIRAFDTP